MQDEWGHPTAHNKTWHVIGYFWLFQLLDILPVCRDFKSGQCKRPQCKYVHLVEGKLIIHRSVWFPPPPPGQPRALETQTEDSWYWVFVDTLRILIIKMIELYPWGWGFWQLIQGRVGIWHRKIPLSESSGSAGGWQSYWLVHSSWNKGCTLNYYCSFKKKNICVQCNTMRSDN